MLKAVLPNDLQTITSEIKHYMNQQTKGIFEIGERLKHVKENDLTHGEWEKWCDEEIKMSRLQTNKYVRVYERFGNRKSTFVLPQSIELLNLMCGLSDEQLDSHHVITSTGIEKTFDQMNDIEKQEVVKVLRGQKTSPRSKASFDKKMGYDVCHHAIIAVGVEKIISEYIQYEYNFEVDFESEIGEEFIKQLCSQLAD